MGFSYLAVQTSYLLAPSLSHTQNYHVQPKTDDSRRETRLRGREKHMEKRQLISVFTILTVLFFSAVASFLSSHPYNPCYSETSTKTGWGEGGGDQENKKQGVEVCWYLLPLVSLSGLKRVSFPFHINTLTQSTHCYNNCKKQYI